MAIDPIQSSIPQVGSIKKPTFDATQKSGKPESFGEALKQAVTEVEGMQKEADQQIEGLMLKKDGVTPHEAMVALEKADIAFQLMNRVRGKIVRAYEEVMRTQV